MSLSRRRFAFWIGLGLFSLSEKLRARSLDDLAALTMRVADTDPKFTEADKLEHWTIAVNRLWRWYERENMVDGAWKVTGITTPVNKETGEFYKGHEGYLADELVPPRMRIGDRPSGRDPQMGEEDLAESGRPDPERRARHGRPPSKWLRSLNADELRIWLKKIEVPEAGVSGMTFFQHLTRDHFFDADRITGLNEDEQAKLHAAAHYGY